MKRTTERTYAFDLIFQIGFHGRAEAEKSALLYLDNAGAADGMDRDFVLSLFCGTLDNLEKIDGIIAEYSSGWSVSRISKPDLAILRLAIYELLYTGTPEKVVANEAVELAKKYSAEESGAFVNGILGSVIRMKLES